MQHQHFNIETALATVHRTFSEMRQMPNVGRNDGERAAIDNQRRPEAEELRVAFTRYYLTLINEGVDQQLQAHMVGCVLADCILDWITGYDIAADMRPAQVVMGALIDQYQAGMYATIQGDMGAVSNGFDADPSGRA